MEQDRPTDRDETSVPDPQGTDRRSGDATDETDRDGSGKQYARGVPPDPDRSADDRDDAETDPQGSGKQYARGVPPDPGPPERP